MASVDLVLKRCEETLRYWSANSLLALRYTSPFMFSYTIQVL